VSSFELVWALYEALAQQCPNSMAFQQILVGETEVYIFLLLAIKLQCAVSCSGGYAENRHSKGHRYICRLATMTTDGDSRILTTRVALNEKTG
jgi:hypothetical protein